MGNRLRRVLQVGLLPAVDVLVVWTATALAYFLRFQGVVPRDFLDNVVPVASVATLLFLAFFYLFRLYHQVWRYAGLDVALRMAGAVTVAFLVMALVDVYSVAPGEVRPAPIGTLLIMSTFVFLASGGARFYARVTTLIQGQSGERQNVLIIGAGDAGSLLLRDIRSHPSMGVRVVGFLDDDPNLRGRLVAGARVLGPIELLPRIVNSMEVGDVYLAIPSVNRKEKRRILDLCFEANVRTKLVPELTGTISPGIADLRRVEIEDLLGRDPVSIDHEGVRRTIRGRVVAVTGAAGSIGSELCRQAAALRPERLVLIEIDETRLYEIYLEIQELGATVPIMHICDIRDDRKLREILLEERPSILLHAAAYKHVPLMELAPDEAVKTNVTGTWNALEASRAAGVEHFVLISTDKAVAPTTVMGLTKAIAEQVTLDACRRGLRTTVVRFGNVLGSRGSVVPLFEQQLNRGGPLRVTHPDVTRYFMTIPEAALLVLQAQAISEGGEIFVLEMGEPVRIVDVAQRMIALSGATANIEFTGLRPAEKLHEVLTTAEVTLTPTDAEKIDRLSAIRVPPENIEAVVRTLGMLARTDERDGMKAIFAVLMPKFEGHGMNALNVTASIPDIPMFDSEMGTLF